MMSKRVKHVLNVAARAVKGGSLAGRLRREGLIPAIVYSKGAAGKPLSVNSAEWESLLKYEFNLVTLAEKGAEERLALVKEVQHDPVRGKAIHVDFQEVRRDEVITSEVKLHRGHVDPAGLALGGMLEQVLHEMEVSCLPDALPESIEVNVSKMNIGDAIKIKDVVMPEGVKAIGNPDQIVFVVELPSIEEEVKPAAAEGAEAAEGAAAAEPEVIGAKERAEKAAEKEAAKGGGEEAKKK
jgi:large subunit ribosomal protein L25